MFSVVSVVGRGGWGGACPHVTTIHHDTGEPHRIGDLFSTTCSLGTLVRHHMDLFNLVHLPLPHHMEDNPSPLPHYSKWEVGHQQKGFPAHFGIHIRSPRLIILTRINTKNLQLLI